jgi:hypothetical protein
MLARLLPFALLLLVGSAPPRPAFAAPRLPWTAGEQLEMQVDLAVLADAARVHLEVLPEAGSGVRLLADVTPGPLMGAIMQFHYRVLSTLSLPKLLPIEGSRQMQQGTDAEFTALSFDRARLRVEERQHAGGEVTRAEPIEAETRDLLAALYHLRAKPAAAAATSVYENGRLYRVEMQSQPGGEIEVPAGRFTSRRYRIEASSVGGERPVRAVDLWVSDDSRRLPLRMEAETPIGKMVAVLLRSGNPPKGG